MVRAAATLSARVPPPPPHRRRRGKFVNCGQTCVAPDYVLVEREAKERLVEAMKRTVREFFGEDPRASPHYARIVSKRHAERLQSLLR
ncbi:MAG: aldehyde dehydrogenase family protein, partial [Pannonibacter indicus]